MRRILMSLCVGLLASVSFVGCGDDQTTHEVTDVRERGQSRMNTPHGLTDEQRLGLRQRGPAGGHGTEPAFAWKTPEGWEEVKAGGMRKGSWKVAGHPDTDCSLIMLQGSGGDELSNINRWRGQMGLDSIDAAALAALPSKQMLGKDAHYMNVVGVYGGMKGMGGETTPKNARMLGLALHMPMVAVFLKFVGPPEVVEAEQANFAALAASLKFGTPKARTPAAAHGDQAADGLAWDAPAGWVQKPPRMMRVVTFSPKDAAGTECYVTVLSGDAGGTEANINRWMLQMGQKELSPAEIAALPSLDVLGKKATMVTIGGKFVGMGEANVEGAMMYALVCERPNDVVFVKMTGPAKEMKGEKEAFEAFCKSLR